MASNNNNKRIFRCSALPTICFGVFEDMKRNGEYCDIKIKFGNRTISAHRVVVAAGIPYFRTRFADRKVGDSSKEITMRDIDPDSLERLIEFAYTHEVEIAEDNVESLLCAACALNVEQVLEACVDFISERLCAENVLRIWELSEKLNSFKLKENIVNYICQNFDDVVSTDNFLNAPFSYVKELIGNDDLQASSEEKVYEFAMKWVKKESSKRKDCLPDILRYVRLKLLSPHYLVNKVATEELIMSSFPCRDLLDEARNYYVLLSDKKKDLTRSGARSEKKSFGGSPCRNLVSDMYLLTEESSLIAHRFEPEKEEWVTTKTAPLNITTGTITEISGKLCYIDRGRIRVYDFSSKTWSMKTVRAIPRFCAEAVTLNKILYLCGGRDAEAALNVVESFDVERDFKRSTVACMSKQRNLHGMVALGEYIYAIGGQNKRGAHESVEKYNPNTNLWTKVSPMLTKRHNFGCTVANGKIYVCGGNESIYNQKCLFSAEVYDPVKNQWKFISSMKTARQRFSLLSFCGKLYAVGGQNDELVNMNTVEVYDLDKDQWYSGPPICCNSSPKGVSVSATYFST